MLLLGANVKPLVEKIRSSPPAGTEFGVQFAAVPQALLVPPFQVLTAENEVTENKHKTTRIEKIFIFNFVKGFVLEFSIQNLTRLH